MASTRCSSRTSWPPVCRGCHDRQAALWRERVKWFPTSIISGPITYYDGRLFVPLSSFEVAAAGLPTHECCRSHGGIAALDATTGTARSGATTRRTRRGQDRRQSPTACRCGARAARRLEQPDRRCEARPALFRHRAELVVAGYRHQAATRSLRLDLKTGAQRWIFQALADDAWNGGCLGGGASCPARMVPTSFRRFRAAGPNASRATCCLPARSRARSSRSTRTRHGAARLAQADRLGQLQRRRASRASRPTASASTCRSRDPERKVAGYVPAARPRIGAGRGRRQADLVAPGRARLQIRSAGRPLVGLAEMAKGRSDAVRRGPSAATTTASRPPP